MRIILLVLLFPIAAIASPVTIDVSGAGCPSWTWNQSANSLTCNMGTTQPPINPPVNPPSGNWNGTCPGFDRTLVYFWDWSQPAPSHLDTLSMGGLGTNGIFVVYFIPNAPLDVNNVTSSSLTGYPAPNMINTLTMALSTTPCDLNPPAPGVSVSTSPSVSYGVGTVPKPWAGPKTAVELQPGTRYYLNIAGRDERGANTCINPPSGWNCDVRLSPQKPPGH